MQLTTRTKAITTLTLVLLMGGFLTADYLHRNTVSGNVTNGGVMKAEAADVRETAESMGLELSTASEPTFLGQIEGTDGSFVVLHNGDRAGSVTWIDSPNVKTQFITLKDALLESFSPDLQDLKDVTEQEAGKPVRNMLSFRDSSLSEDMLVFIRVRERLLEFHVTAGGEDTMNALIAELTTN